MKSTSGYAFLFGSCICSWLSKKQSVVAQSTAEAEYVSASKATSQAIWLRRIFEDIGEKQKKWTVLYCDNKSAIAIVKNPFSNERSKHISIKYHFIREAKEKGEIQLHYYQTGEQISDIFTEGLSRFFFLSSRPHWSYQENALRWSVGINASIFSLPKLSLSFSKSLFRHVSSKL